MGGCVFIRCNPNSGMCLGEAVPGVSSRRQELSE